MSLLGTQLSGKQIYRGDGVLNYMLPHVITVLWIYSQFISLFLITQRTGAL